MAPFQRSVHRCVRRHERVKANTSVRSKSLVDIIIIIIILLLMKKGMLEKKSEMDTCEKRKETKAKKKKIGRYEQLTYILR